MRLAGALGVRGRPGDDGLERDEAGPVGDLPGLLERGPQLLEVLLVAGAVIGPVDAVHVPAVGGVARGDVLGEGDVGVALDGDVVVVVDQRQVAEPLRAGDRGGLGGDALLQVAVAADAVDLVVERALARSGVGVEETALAAGRHSHADGVPDALPERAGGGLDAGGVPVLRVAGGLAAPGAQRLEVLDLEAVAGQVELGVERDAAVPGREHEPVPARPSRGPPGCAASPSGTRCRRPGPGSWRCRGGRCRPSARRPWRARGRCPPRAGRGRSSRACSRAKVLSVTRGGSAGSEPTQPG